MFMRMVVTIEVVTVMMRTMMYGDSDGIMIALIIVVSVVRPEVMICYRSTWCLA